MIPSSESGEALRIQGVAGVKRPSRGCEGHEECASLLGFRKCLQTLACTIDGPCVDTHGLPNTFSPSYYSQIIRTGTGVQLEALSDILYYIELTRLPDDVLWGRFELKVKEHRRKR